MEIIASISSAIALARQILALPGMEKNAELRLLVADLQIKLAEAQSKMAETMAENHQLRADLAKATSPPEVVFKDGVYYKTDGDGPFCTTCHDGGRGLFRLDEVATMFHDTGRYRCGNCKNRFQPRARG